MIDMRVGDGDLFHLQVMFRDNRQHVFNVITGINDDCFPGGLVADDGAVALQRANRKNLVDHAVVFAWQKYKALSRGLGDVSLWATRNDFIAAAVTISAEQPEWPEQRVCSPASRVASW